MRTTLKLASAIAALALVFGACGDDDDEPTFDARDTVDSAPTPDGAPTFDAAPTPADLRSGVIAVNELQVANDLTSVGLPGGVTISTVSISFSDLTTEDVPAPAFGNASLGLGECQVFRYTVGTDEEFDSVDEGAVTIASAESADDAGIIDPAINPGTFPPCAYVGALESYNCFAVAPGTAFTGAAVDHDATNSRTVLTVPGADFNGMQGFAAIIDGFTAPQNNGEFPIVAVISAEVIVVLNFAAALGGFPDALDESSVDGTFGAVAGASAPVPNGLGYDFLDDGSNDMTVTKADGDVVPGFTVASISSSGSGLTLADGSDDLDDFPTTAGDWVISCDDQDNGDCGNAGGLIVGFALSGRTSDGSLTTGCRGGPCLPVELPDAETEYATFTCRGSLGASDLTLPSAAVTEILATSPTRIEARALRITADLSTDSSGVTSVVAGHGIVGWTTPAP